MPTIVRFWILLSTLLVSAGWILSALHQLNRTGYGVFFALGLFAFICWQRKTGWSPQKNPAQLFNKFRRRFKHPAPFLFLALAFMSLAAGLLYVHTNGDSMCYRIPRVLHWLGHGQWHWIHTWDDRMNIVGCGFEWLCAPLMLFTRTDWFIFLINWVSYLMLPGLIFGVFTRLGVRPRVAWWWMWLLASGWCYAMQAASDINDSFPVIYALAAVYLALRAREKNCVTDAWLSMLAAALLTGGKQTSIPLVAVWLVAAWPVARLLLARPLTTICVAATGVLVSAAPLIFFNLEHVGTWSGIPAHVDPAAPLWGTQAASPFWAAVGNLFCLPVENLSPPVIPGMGRWDDMMGHFLRTPFGSHFISFENFGALPSGISETNAGIGLGICVLTLVSILGARHYRRIYAGAAAKNKNDRLLWMLRLIPFLSLLVFMSQVVTYQNARQLAAYYVFFFPLLLAGSGHGFLVRKLWWQRLGLLVMMATAILLILARSRPLFPARTVITRLQAMYPQSKFLSQNLNTYFSISSVETQRKFISQVVPPGEPVIGYATTWYGSEPQMWYPLGQRRVERVLPGDTVEELRQLGIHFVFVDNRALESRGRPEQTIQEWMNRYDATLVAKLSMETNRVDQNFRIYLVHLGSKPEEN